MRTSGIHPSNNLDFWRVAAAAMVLVSHQYALLGLPQPAVTPLLSLGSLGVCIFFVISGYLVTQSWRSDPHVVRFLVRRFLRIWPGLAVVVGLSALVLGPLVTERSFAEYFKASETWHYFNTLILQIRFELPGVFESIPYPRAVNGSLWTIPMEVQWYALAAAAGMFGLLRLRYVLAVALVAMALYHFFTLRSGAPGPRDFFLEYGLFFMSGALLWLFRDEWTGRAGIWAGALLAIALVLVQLGFPYAAITVGLPFLVIWTGLRSTPVLRRFGRFGDLSFGIYIYAFPVQQLVAWMSDARLGVAHSLALSAAATVACAAMSWHLVEKPALSLKPAARRGPGAPAIA